MVQTFIRRPTSPLVYEPLYTPPEDVLYPGSEEEATADEREKKRLRVETQGQQYLKGRPLFIQSAGLRGPFGKDWVNPWASKKRKYGIDDIRRFPQAETAAIERHLPVEAGPSTAKRRPVAVSGYGSLDYESDSEASVGTEEHEQEEHKAKRRRHAELDEPPGGHESQRKYDLAISAPGGKRHRWLKTEKAYPATRIKKHTRSTTPTPVAKPRSTSHLTSSLHFEQLERAETSPHNLNDQRRLSPSKQQVLHLNGTNASITSTTEKKVGLGNVEVAASDLDQEGLDPANSMSAVIRERSLTRADIVTRNGYDAVKRLSQQAVRRAELEDGQLQAKKLSEEAIARAIRGDLKKPTSRLTPYVSEVVLGNDAASSAALKAVKAPKPQPSPHVAPPSTYHPEFRYRYTRKGSSSSTSPQRAPFVDAPEQLQTRPRTDSSSSSGSSAFAEALEAAQGKAASKSFASSKSSSPPIEGRETKSIKKNRQALRRLTFTPSGGAKVTQARTSSRPSSSSSVAGPAKAPLHSSNDPPSLLRTSTKSSARSLTNANGSRNSIILPEAQSDPIIRPPLAQVPSGPSTTLLETDKPSLEVPSFDEGDSYLGLSTQAAVLKAQRSFQAEVVSALTPRHLKTEKSSPTGSPSRLAEITPTARRRQETEAANAQLIKASGSDDEEPMSTQEMVDSISPFAITTIKKRPQAVQNRTSLIPSPTILRKTKSPPAATFFPESPTESAFRAHSPGMSTSPTSTPSPSPEKSPPPPPLSHPATNSKPPSSLTSFSILPNGTLTETSLYQQDGQQQQDIPEYDISLPLDPFGFDDDGGNGDAQGGNWDLNAAIEEAGSFLGDWNVEAEARKEGRKRESGNTSTVKGSP
ncbi:hypothetical protein BDR22DRAFT_841008 [Usnea florida]